MLAKFGKEAVKKGLYNINKANIHIPASNLRLG